MSIKERVLGIWKDPVWSKVIATAIVAIVVSLWAYFNWETTKKWLLKIVNFQWNVLYVLLAVGILFLIYKFFTRKKVSKEEKIRKELELFNTSFNEDDTVKFTWEVGIQTFYGKDPFAHNIQSFCMLHSIPLRFKHHCREYGCQNSNIVINEYDLKNWIESVLIDNYAKIKAKH
jgi:hypothetical protein